MPLEDLQARYGDRISVLLGSIQYVDGNLVISFRYDFASADPKAAAAEQMAGVLDRLITG